MIKVKVTAYNVPPRILKTGVLLGESKIIKLVNVPNVREWIVWRNQNFRITKVTHIADSDDYAAIIEMEWCESVKPLT